MYILIQELNTLFSLNQNKKNAQFAEQYLKNKFTFFGLSMPIRSKLITPWLKNLAKYSNQELLALIFELYQQQQREFHYTAIDIFTQYYQKFSYNEIIQLEDLIDTKSWWDTVDRLQKPFSLWIKKNIHYQDVILESWLNSPSFWKRRSAIISQLLWKQDLNTNLLSKAILANKDDKEFFIRKAIGWALRDYAKTNPEWVKNFLNTHTLSPLSRREASKYL